MVRRENGVEPIASVPADIVLASGSGLDPDISPEAAIMQIKRVAHARGLPEEAVRGIVQRLVEAPLFGFIGQGRVNVLRLNLVLDGLHVSSLRLDAYPSGCGKR
jgi:potassium-transporting ATPase KdpC subunit